jgi:hypothetical protein
LIRSSKSPAGAGGPTERRILEHLSAGEHAKKVTVTEGGVSFPGELLNFTAAGVSLICPRPFDSGASLSLVLSPLEVARPVRVIHATRLATQGYRVGAKFDQSLTFLELQALIGPAASS